MIHFDSPTFWIALFVGINLDLFFLYPIVEIVKILGMENYTWNFEEISITVVLALVVLAVVLGGLYYHWEVVGDEWFQWFYTIKPYFIYGIALTIPFGWIIIGIQLSDTAKQWLNDLF